MAFLKVVGWTRVGKADGVPEGSDIGPVVGTKAVAAVGLDGGNVIAIEVRIREEDT
jgi:hypothetical protein